MQTLFDLEDYAVKSSSELLSGEGLMRLLHLSRTTLWRLRNDGLPHVKVGRLVRYNVKAVRAWLEGPGKDLTFPTNGNRHSHSGQDGHAAAIPRANGHHASSPAELPPCHWSPSVALDPKHRPQSPCRPSTTVRREWWRFPQEAHLHDEVGGRYRRLLAREVAVIQGFPADWGAKAGLGELDLIRGYGNAVPPPLSQALFESVRQFSREPLRTVVEICAGFGGMALGVTRAFQAEHLALVDNWAPAAAVLRGAGLWPEDAVMQADVESFDWSRFTGKVDVLCGGPPCQPWSNAGAGRGERDERDLLGYTPELVAAVQPKVFVFENVPGLLQGENEAYAAWLIQRLRRPRPGLAYGVAAAVVNAADYAVPQVRRRVLIVGLLGEPVEAVHRLFDDLHARRTHADPRAAAPGRKPKWRTIGDAVADWGDANHAWRRWLVPAAVHHSTTNGVPMNQQVNTATAAVIPVKRIQLIWPHRGTLPSWQDGNWHLDSTRRDDASLGGLSPLLPLSDDADPARDPWYVVGDPVVTLDALLRTAGRRAELVYLDLPRIQTDAATFEAAEATARLDTWLTVVHALLRRGLRLLDDRGVIVALCGVNELPYVQELLNELQGPECQIGVVAWQKGYSPRNMKGMKEFTPTHDNLVVFAKRKATLPAVHLKVPPDGFKNPDGDPRGSWNAEQKGANKSDCDYEVHVCPYRWRIVGGDTKLPPGMWRINPKSGVIWAKPGDLTEPGEWSFKVEVEDSKGHTTQKKFTIRVAGDVPPPPLAQVPWLEAKRSGKGFTGGPEKTGDLRIVTSKLPAARLGEEYSACVLAAGGKPWVGQTRPGKTSATGDTRYWEFPFKTLHDAAARDMVDFKQTDDAIPAIKTYLGHATSTPLNQMTTWLGRGKKDDDPFAAGYSSDAKKELQALRDAGFITEIVEGSKPAPLMCRLLGLFTSAHGLVVDVGSPAAEMAALATATGRKAVYIEFPGSEAERDSILTPRLAAAARGKHLIPTGVLFSKERLNVEAGTTEKGFILAGERRTEMPNGGVFSFGLGAPFAAVDREAGVVSVDYAQYPTTDPNFLYALASMEGLVPVKERRGLLFATSVDGNLGALHIPSTMFLDERLLRQIREEMAWFVGPERRLRVYYHRGQDGRHMDRDEADKAALPVELRLIPYELQLAAGLL